MQTFYFPKNPVFDMVNTPLLGEKDGCSHFYCVFLIVDDPLLGRLMGNLSVLNHWHSRMPSMKNRVSAAFCFFQNAA
jgi:hypothetical protein